MKAYFRRLNSSRTVNHIGTDEIALYRTALVAALKKQGATEADIDLVSDTMIINSINERRNPEAVAWAILQ